MARLSPEPAKAARPDAAAPLAVKRPSRLRVGLLYLLFFVCLAQAGLIGGAAFTHYFPHLTPGYHAAEPAGAAEKHKDEPESHAAQSAEAPSAEYGDGLLREGRYDLARKVYDPLAATASGALRDALQYRVALCEEGLGHTEEALKTYRAMATRTENPRNKAAAEVGQARVLVRRRKPAEARDLLYPLLLRSGDPALKDQPCVADARYLLALTLTLDTHKPEKPGPLSDAPADYTATDWPVEAALDWVRLGSEAKAEAAAQPEKESNYVGVDRSGSGPDAMRVSAAVPPTKLAYLIERLAERAKLRVEWTEAARKAADDRSAALAWQDLPVADVFIDLILPLTDPLGLVATLKDGTLRLATEAETPPAAVTAYRKTTAQRALKNAVTSNPDHRLTAAAYLELGNLEARAGRLKEAAGYYDRLAYEFRHSPLVVEANYNLGLVLLKQGQTIEARSAFYATRDHAPGHELAPLALLQVGRTFLLENDPEQAIKPLTDALAVSAGTPVEPAAALTAGAAYLLTDNPQQALRVVREHRDAVEQPPYRATAIFLDAYGQFLAVKGAKGKDTAHPASELQAALWAVEGKEPVLGAAGPLLIGHAYHDLDQPEETIAVYQKALPGLKGPLAAEMSCRVAEDLYRHGKYEPARKLYQSLAKDASGRWAADAQLKLAHIALLENRPREAVLACRKLLEEKQAVKRETVLLLMGQAYEKSGEYLKAATCFKGQLPD